MVLTTHMLKKCIKVPKLYKKVDKYDYLGLSEKEYNYQMALQKKQAFKRGVMMFEDYNYDQFNKFILVDPENAESDNDANTVQ